MPSKALPPRRCWTGLRSRPQSGGLRRGRRARSAPFAGPRTWPLSSRTAIPAPYASTDPAKVSPVTAAGIGPGTVIGIAGSVVSKSRTGKPATAASAVRRPQIGQHCPGLNAFEKLLNGDLKDCVPGHGIQLAHRCLHRVRCRFAQHRMAVSRRCQRRSNTCGGGKHHVKATPQHRGGIRRKGLQMTGTSRAKCKACFKGAAPTLGFTPEPLRP